MNRLVSSEMSMFWRRLFSEWQEVFDLGVVRWVARTGCRIMLMPRIAAAGSDVEWPRPGKTSAIVACTEIPTLAITFLYFHTRGAS